MKVLFDLRGTQRWRERGIPRYIQNLIFALKAANPTSFEASFLYEVGFDFALWHSELEKIGNIHFDSDDLSGLSFDYFIVGSPFLQSSTGQSVGEYLLPAGLHRRNVSRLAAIIYDFIPWRFQKDYLSREGVKKNYLETLEFLNNLDLLLPISKSALEDTAQLFPLHFEQNRIVNINGGIGTYRGKAPSVEIQPGSGLLSQFGLELNKYWIYVGGDDPRKNLGELLESVKARKNLDGFPIVIVCKISIERQNELLSSLAPKFKKQIKFTGYLPDNDLWALIKGAFGSVFVSKFEGLGLPVLESYAVQTPVLCSNNSSLKDLAPLECLIENSNAIGIAEAMEWAESNSVEFKKKSLDHWKSISDQYSWEFSAREAFSGLSRVLEEPAFYEADSRQESENVFWYSILPPAKSGIAEYDFKLFSSTPEGRLPVFVPTNLEEVSSPHLLSFKHLHAKDVPFFAESKAIRCFTLGNSEHHIQTLIELARFGSSVGGQSGKACLYLHEAALHGMWSCYFSSFPAYKKFLLLHYGNCHSKLQYANSIADLNALGVCGVLPLLRLAKIEKIFVNSEYARQLIMADVGKNDVSIETMFLPIYPSKIRHENSLKNSKNEKVINVGCFGIADAAKASVLILEACELLIKRGYEVNLVFAGYSLNYIKSRIAEHHFWVTLVENSSYEELEELMASVDVAVQLRERSHGEASGVVCQLLALNVPVVVSKIGWFLELGNAVSYVPVGVKERELADAILTTFENSVHFKREAQELALTRSPANFWDRFYGFFEQVVQGSGKM